MSHFVGALKYPNSAREGCTVLYPYLMTRSCDEQGNAQDQGRYCVAYSRDGWWLIDADAMVVLRWCATEADAVAAREELLS